MKMKTDPSKYATALRDGFTVPLIGIPAEAGAQKCDGCQVEFGMREVEMSESGKMLCAKCREEKKAQRWLAAQLPDSLFVRDGEWYWNIWFDDLSRPLPVTPREWLHVVSLVEAKLTYDQRREYCARLFNLPVAECESNTFATWQQRTRELMEVLK